MGEMMLTSALRFLRILPRPEHHGSAGWEPPAASWLGTRGVPTSEHPMRRQGPGGFFLGTWKGRSVALPRVEALRHGIVVGGSGTGKSRGFFLPNAAWGAGKGSIVCTDPKSELFRLTSGFHPTAVRYAPTDPDASSCFNWIPLCRDAATAELCARAIVESGNTAGTEQAWLDMEAAYLSGVFAHAATLPEPTPLSAYRMITGLPTEDLINELLNSSSGAAREQALVFSQTQEKMRGSIVPVVAARLQWLRDPQTARFCSASLDAPTFEQLRERPMGIYWCLREADIGRLRPLTSLFFSLMLERLARGSENGEGFPVTMLLDEFANIGTIPAFETTLTLARGRGVSLWLGVQSLSQLEARYGKANAATILANCGTKIALSGLDIDSAEYFSRALGETTAAVGKTSRHGLLNASYSHSRDEHARRLMTADEVRRLPSDQAIVIVGNQRPMQLKKHFYDAPAKTAPTGKLDMARAATFREERLPLPPFPTLERPALGAMKESRFRKKHSERRPLSRSRGPRIDD